MRSTFLGRLIVGAALFALCVTIGGVGSSPSHASPNAADPTPVSFAPYQAYPTGSSPESVAIGDFTGDGRKDIALSTSTYFSSNDWKVFLFVQRPDGSLDTPVLFNTDHGGGDTMALAAGDLNNDGRTDLALSTVNGIDVFYQQGGMLQPAVLVSHDLTGDVDIADVNGDGYNDIVESEGGIRLLLGSSSGFGAPVTVSTQDTYEVELGDVTGDGRIDIVGTNGGTFYVFSQLADGTFSPPATYSVVPGPFYGGIEVADVTGDHRLDVVAAVGGNNPKSVQVFRQNAAGTLDSPVTYGTLDSPGPVEAADLNGDGVSDLIVVHNGYLKAGVYLQKADGTLGNESLYTIPYATRYRPNGVAIGDINGDGALDIAISDANNGLVVLRQVGGPTPSPIPVGGIVELPSASGSSGAGWPGWAATALVALAGIAGILWWARGTRRSRNRV